MQLFINGSGTTPSESWGASTFNSSAEFQVGGAQNPTSQNFDGLIDDVRVWDRALLDSEIVNIYNDSVGTSNGSNLQGSWKFDNSYADVSSNVNTLTGQNSPVFSNDKAYGGSSAGSDSYTYAGTLTSGSFSRAQFEQRLQFSPCADFLGRQVNSLSRLMRRLPRWRIAGRTARECGKGAR